ncbi:peptide ABC transporter ATP-binding protein [Aeromicrobium sp. PE09-221]|uniref:dipeptide ABC transporter ATP-binding protein n=1 Tax=Aeromicrobium sp. PE09-221 TaxID=1898043 RepID=UPI000B3ECFAE|nr:ABC transporter ATP-binding protein [Aeromicrobium sp. PE09-221]OUZ10644.1 peptide ABC transporter ATP-binding protein [Aeromicrobium sp. PE09-221]
MTTSTVAAVRGLRVSYDAGDQRVTVAEDIDFELTRGRTLGLVGESGSGKSTVARTLLGHLRDGSRIDAGTVTVFEDDVFALAPAPLRQLRGGTVALVAQNAGHALTPSMRIGAQLRETLDAHGLPSGDDRLIELLDLVRLPSPDALIDRYPHELSGGQQQRVAIAMAVSTDPKILVLDEPTTALDVITQAAVLALVNELRERLGMAVLIVSHDLGVVSAVADDVLVMRLGREVEHGPTQEVLNRPREEYTRQLIAAAPRVHGVDIIGREDPDADVVVRCRDVDIRYPRAPRLAVSGFDVEILRGETVAVVGESGSGKSTVASALAGLADVERGEAALWSSDGTRHDLLGAAARRPVDVRRSVQLIFQNADLALNPRRTVGDAIARPLKVFGRASRAETPAVVDRLLTEVGLGPEFARRVPAQLSGGQRQRVGIARALAAEPTLLIADEITTALDVSVQAEVLALLDHLRESRGLSCLFISHDLAVVRSVADRIVVMKDGRIVESAPTAVLFEEPRHPYTRSLLEAVIEPGHTELPGSDADHRTTTLDPDAPLIDIGNGHRVRDDEGALTTR